MLENWLSPISLEKIAFDRTGDVVLGHHITVYSPQNDSLSNCRIALLGVNGDCANQIRKHLYSLFHHFGNLKIVDLGNARNNSVPFITAILKELLDGNIIPILLGANTDLIKAQYQAHYAKKQLTNLVVVDDRIAFDLNFENEQNYLNEIIQSRKLFHLGAIAYQSLFNSPAVYKYFKNRHYDLVRLGQVRANMEEVEPIIRDADLLAFNLSAIRFAEAMAQSRPNPNGLLAEEACQISWYAGMSDKLGSIGFYGYDLKNDLQQQTAQLIAQLVWYFIEGVYHRKNDFPVSTEDMVEYIINIKKYEHQLTFWKSQKSGRWWMQIPVKTKKKHERHRLLPCSYQDYLAACKDELPERLFKAYQRFL